MSNQRKQNISVRLSAQDLRRVRDIAARLQVRESDVFRFAVRASLAKLTPLQDGDAAGADLVPVFIDFGSELMSYFELDRDRLNAIINGELQDEQKRVAKEDIELLALWGLQDKFLFVRLKDYVGGSKEGVSPSALLRRYLLDKYVSADDAIRNDLRANVPAEGPDIAESTRL
jgi:Arc/MetJ-type ribon-helix-helix transcriptional regulator